MNAIVLGANSDIAKGLTALMRKDGWSCWGWSRESSIKLLPKWDLVVCAIGTVAPVGLWHEQNPDAWEESVRSNVLLPVRLLRELWPRRMQGAAVCFLAGSNPNKVMSGYSAYNAGKMALLKVCEQLDHESPDCKFFALGPGYIDTKVHRPTREANWPNERIDSGKPGNTIEQVYESFLWCLAQPKEVVGGRNICVSDEKRGLGCLLRENPSLFKLRRCEG